jgi:hypothetical protein
MNLLEFDLRVWYSTKESTRVSESASTIKIMSSLLKIHLHCLPGPRRHNTGINSFHMLLVLCRIKNLLVQSTMAIIQGQLSCVTEVWKTMRYQQFIAFNKVSHWNNEVLNAACVITRDVSCDI